MIGANDFIAIGDIGLRTQEERAVIAHVFQKIIGVARQNLDVLTGDLVRNLDHFFVGINQDHLAAIAPGGAGQISRRQRLQLTTDLGFYALGE